MDTQGGGWVLPGRDHGQRVRRGGWVGLPGGDHGQRGRPGGGGPSRWGSRPAWTPRGGWAFQVGITASVDAQGVVGPSRSGTPELGGVVGLPGGDHGQRGRPGGGWAFQVGITPAWTPRGWVGLPGGDHGQGRRPGGGWAFQVGITARRRRPGGGWAFKLGRSAARNTSTVHTGSVIRVGRPAQSAILRYVRAIIALQCPFKDMSEL